ncbi:hypothetical protein CCANI_09550 [Corynebacterium canis]|nr:hypothetical protein CCANI_09550 [Corynebacterium canis]
MMKITQNPAFVCKKLHAQHTTNSCGEPIALRRADLCSSPPMGLLPHGNWDGSVWLVAVFRVSVCAFGFEHGFDRGQQDSQIEAEGPVVNVIKVEGLG